MFVHDLPTERDKDKDKIFLPHSNVVALNFL